VLGVDHRDDAVEPAGLGLGLGFGLGFGLGLGLGLGLGRAVEPAKGLDRLVCEEGLRNRRRVGEASRFDDDEVDLRLAPGERW